MNPEPVFLDYLLDTSIKAVELPKKDVTIRLDANYQFTRQDCVDIYKAFPQQVHQLRKSLNTYYPDYKSPLEIDLLDTQILSTKISGITFNIIHRKDKFEVSTYLHDYTFDTLLKTRLEKREDLYDLLNKATNTTYDVTFWLTEIANLENSILHLYKQQKH